jgi:hypothetical protein
MTLFFFILLLFLSPTADSKKQYKTQFSKWGIDTKRIKRREYQAMLGKKRKRECEEPPKPTKFQLHGKNVPDTKIARWEARMLKQGKITGADTFSDVGERYCEL